MSKSAAQTVINVRFIPIAKTVLPGMAANGDAMMNLISVKSIQAVHLVLSGMTLVPNGHALMETNATMTNAINAKSIKGAVPVLTMMITHPHGTVPIRRNDFQDKNEPSRK